MVTEPTQPTDGNQTKIDYQQDIPMEFQQQRSQMESNAGSKGMPLKPDSAESKAFQLNSDASNQQSVRQFGPGYNDNMQRYSEGMIGPSNELHFPAGSLANTNNTNSLTANTPTLNQLLTQSSAPTKYPSGYGEYPNASGGGPGGAPSNPQPMYDGWNSTAQPQQGSVNPNTVNAVRPGMPSPNRPLAPNSQVDHKKFDLPDCSVTCSNGVIFKRTIMLQLVALLYNPNVNVNITGKWQLLFLSKALYLHACLLSRMACSIKTNGISPGMNFYLYEFYL